MRFITTTYEGPDLDGYGCAMAYAELLRVQGQDARAHVWGTPQLEVQWLLETFKLSHADGPTDDTNAQVVLLDASSKKDLPAPLRIEQVIEIIDHRKLHEADQFFNAQPHIELVGAAATLVAERFKKTNVVPSKESALFLFGGIVSNTHNFTAATTDRDREMAAWLKKIGEVSDELPRQMFMAKSDLSGSRLRDALFGDFKTIAFGPIHITMAQLEIVGVTDLLTRRRGEIESILKEIQSVEKTEYILLNMIDLNTNLSHILCLNEQTKAIIQHLPDATWDGLLCTNPTLVLRKQISAWILEAVPSV